MYKNNSSDYEYAWNRIRLEQRLRKIFLSKLTQSCEIFNMSLFPNHPPHGFLKARQSRSRVEKLQVPLFSLIQSCPCLSRPFFFFFLLFSYCCFQGNHTNVGTHDSAKQVGGLREQREKKAERVQKEKLGQKKVNRKQER